MRFATIAVFLFTLLLSIVAVPIPRPAIDADVHGLAARAFKIGDVVHVKPSALSKDPLAGAGSAKGKNLLHPAIVTDIDSLGNAVVAPISHTASAISSDISKLAPSTGLSGFVHVGDKITAAAKDLVADRGGRTASSSDLTSIKDEIAKFVPRELPEKRAFKIGDVVHVKPSALSKDPLAGAGSAKGKNLLHPAIVTDIDSLGNAVVAPISHTASAISSDISKLAPSTGLSGFVHVGDKITAAAKDVVADRGGRTASSSDLTSIKDEIAKFVPRELSEKRAFKIGDVVHVKPSALSKDPLAGAGSAKGKSLLHPAIVTDIDSLGNAVVAPISHTASAISSDISKLAPSTGLSGFVHVGDKITAAAKDVVADRKGRTATGGEVSSIVSEITSHLP